MIMTNAVETQTDLEYAVIIEWNPTGMSTGMSYRTIRAESMDSALRIVQTIPMGSQPVIAITIRELNVQS